MRHVKVIFGLCALAIVAPLALWLSIQLDPDPLSGLSIYGQRAPSDLRVLERKLREHADSWEQTEIEVRVEGSAGVTRVRREALGASLPVTPMLSAAREVGHSGNPLLDLGKWWSAQRGTLNLRWPPALDAKKLADFVESEQLRAEEPPIAGVSDGHGYSLPGRDGRALDVATALASLGKALASGSASVILPVKHVSAPPPLAIGSPDGALFDQDPEPTSDPGAVAAPIASMPAREPSAWQPPAANDCFSDPPQRPFCDGPRMVPAPHGAARELASALGLGQLETVGQLIRHGPRSDWVSAAGAPDPEPLASWPVPAGKLGRGFGFVRREELRDRIHAGVDIVAPRGSQILAAHAGIVAYSDNRVRGYGNLLVIVHANGAVTLSAHCQRILVFAGERVARGQVVAEVGMTGLAMGPHLHFELRLAGNPTDPQPLFAQPARVPAGRPGAATPRSRAEPGAATRSRAL